MVKVVLSKKATMDVTRISVEDIISTIDRVGLEEVIEKSLYFSLLGNYNAGLMSLEDVVSTIIIEASAPSFLDLEDVKELFSTELLADVVLEAWGFDTTREE